MALLLYKTHTDLQIIYETSPFFTSLYYSASFSGSLLLNYATILTPLHLFLVIKKLSNLGFLTNILTIY